MLVTNFRYDARTCERVVFDPYASPDGFRRNKDSDGESLPSSIHSNDPARNGSNAALTNEPRTPSELDVDNVHFNDVSVSFFEDGEYIFPHENEELDVDDSEFEVKIHLQRGADQTEGMETLGEEDAIIGDLQEKGCTCDDDEEKSFTRSGLHKKATVDEAVDDQFFIISKSRLQALAMETCSSCPVCSKEVMPTISAANGSAAHVNWICPEGHRKMFCTQEVIGKSHTGDIRFASAILLSGNNFEKISLLAKFARLNMITSPTFSKLQANYAIPAVEEQWRDVQAQTLAKHSLSSDGVVVCGDARNDSPGHCSQFCTYTFIENDTKDILHVGFVDKRQTAMKSPNMEIRGFKDGLKAMEDSGLVVKEVVTDAHSSIAKYMRESKPQIKHSWDIWHGSKNLAKKLTKASSRAATRPLLYWVKHIIRHFWHCAQTCGGNVNLFKAKWRGLTHHVTNSHAWVSALDHGPTVCEHGEVEDREEWLRPGDPAHMALNGVCYEKKLLDNMKYYVNFRHTSILESLHNHILMYASKRFSFQYPAYRARNLLAVLDYMFHKERPVITDEDGKPKLVAVWSKHAKDWVPVKRKVPKTYNYIESIMRDIFVRRASDDQPMFRPAVLGSDDPRRIRPNLAPLARPPMEEILRRFDSRHSQHGDEVD
ncbi:uncharacterized protein [Diadema setosum]|uniref:uncharacterized protein n=1 Tax=Diadema setosum TaxID=31175 RepID=UPI003B3A6122